MEAAVIPAPGIGDGLLMMIASRALHDKGYKVTLFHDKLQELASLFPFCRFRKREDIEECIKEFDKVILENNTSSFAFSFIGTHRDRGLSVFYPSHSAEKYHPLTPNDYVFNSKEPMAKGVAKAISQLLNIPYSTSNGIVMPNTHSHDKYPKRVAIHPTSGYTKRNWTPRKFLRLAKKLRRAGWTPVFCVSPTEREEWLQKVGGKFSVPEFSNLTELATFLYESSSLIGNDSGLGHLASNLNKPTITLSRCRKFIALWRPGWLLGQVVTPPKWIPNIKKFRLRENKWQAFITTRHVFKTFLSMMK